MQVETAEMGYEKCRARRIALDHAIAVAASKLDNRAIEILMDLAEELESLEHQYLAAGS